MRYWFWFPIRRLNFFYQILAQNSSKLSSPITFRYLLVNTFTRVNDQREILRRTHRLFYAPPQQA